MGSLRKLRRAKSIRPRKGKAAKIQQKKKSPSVSEFRAFFEKVMGRPGSQAEWQQAKNFIKRFESEFDNPNISLERIKAIWNQIAPFYPKVLEPKVMQSEISVIHTHVPIARSDKIASLGSGTAILEAFLAKNFAPNGIVTCVDMSPKMNQIALCTKEKAQAGNMSIVTASATKTGLPKKSQDKVIIAQTNLVRTVHMEKMFKEARRIIKNSPTARLTLSFYAKISNRKALISEINKALGNCGFYSLIAVRYAQKGKELAIIIIAEPV